MTPKKSNKERRRVRDTVAYHVAVNRALCPTCKGFARTDAGWCADCRATGHRLAASDVKGAQGRAS